MPKTGESVMGDLARDPRQIGNLIRRARKKQGLSQTQLGQKAGLRQETISLIETGNPATTLETILSVLATLDLEFRIMPRSKGRAADIEEIF
jgi:HTH-type transcriptional regulator/antitoxin HipB